MTPRAQPDHIDDPLHNGVKRVGAYPCRALVRRARILHFAVTTIDCNGLASKEEILDRFATALRFPDWFGHNWDALEDCLGDLSWWPAPGYLLILDGLERWQVTDGEGFDTLLEIIDEAAKRWRERGVPFRALLPHVPGRVSIASRGAPSI